MIPTQAKARAKTAAQITLAAVVYLGGAVLTMIAATTIDAWSHQAMPTAAQPQGWNYPYSCCSGVDCRQVTSGKGGLVRETSEGYVIATTNETIPYSDKRVKDSPDGEFHWCSQGGRDTGGTICLFVPPRAF